MPPATSAAATDTAARTRRQTGFMTMATATPTTTSTAPRAAPTRTASSDHPPTVVVVPPRTAAAHGRNPAPIRSAPPSATARPAIRPILRVVAMFALLPIDRVWVLPRVEADAREEARFDCVATEPPSE